jgi:hypothetical protein
MESCGPTLPSIKSTLTTANTFLLTPNHQKPRQDIYAGLGLRPICTRNFSLFAASLPERSASSALSILSILTTKKRKIPKSALKPNSHSKTTCHSLSQPNNTTTNKLTSQLRNPRARLRELLQRLAGPQAHERVQLRIARYEVRVGHARDVVGVYCFGADLEFLDGFGWVVFCGCGGGFGGSC